MQDGHAHELVTAVAEQDAILSHLAGHPVLTGATDSAQFDGQVARSATAGRGMTLPDQNLGTRQHDL
jgi:hypothetical protein